MITIKIDDKRWLAGVVVISALALTLMVASLTARVPVRDSRTKCEYLDIPAAASGNPTSFLSKWDTTKTSTGSSNSNQIKLPLQSSGTYDFIVTWGDGNFDTITTYNQVQATHTYAVPGIYNINITGTCWKWSLFNSGDKLKLLEIYQWGSVRLDDWGFSFTGCANLELTATDAPDLTDVISLTATFSGCAKLGSKGNMNSWNMSGVTDTYCMFVDASSFNQPIGNWDVSRVTNMRLMFWGASSFNQPIGNWNVSRVTNMYGMFWGASSFNQPIGNWNVSRATDMDLMFEQASSFNQPLGNWNVSCVMSMDFMFSQATSFNQPIGNWNVSCVTSMCYMFKMATSFDQDIGRWDVSNVTNMHGFLDGARLSTAIYDAVLLGWSHLTLQYGVVFHGGDSQFSNEAASARAAIISGFIWKIYDGGQELTVPIWLVPAVIVACVCIIILILTMMRRRTIVGRVRPIRQSIVKRRQVSSIYVEVVYRKPPDQQASPSSPIVRTCTTCGKHVSRDCDDTRCCAFCGKEIE